MANIQKRVGKSGAVSYRVQVRLKGKPTRTRSFRRLTDAKGRGRLGSRWIPAHDAAAAPDLRRPGGSLPRRGTAKKTRGKDQRHFAQRLVWWRERLGAYALTEIDAAAVAECRDRIETTQNQYGKPLAGATVNR